MVFARKQAWKTFFAPAHDWLRLTPPSKIGPCCPPVRFGARICASLTHINDEQSRAASNTEMKTRSLLPTLLLLICGLLSSKCPQSCFAHTLPISYMTVVPDADYLHLELSINPFELNFLPLLAWEESGRIDTKLSQTQNNQIERKLLSALQIRVGGKIIPAETSGLTTDPGSHHLTFLAHYRADALHLPLKIESDLAALTGSSHVTEVTYQRDGRQQLARFDAQSFSAQFEPFEKQIPVAAASSAASGRVATWTFQELFFAVAIPVAVVLAGFFWKLREHLQPQH